MKKSFLLFVLLNLFQLPTFSQDRMMDSLNNALQNANQDTTRLSIYIALGQACNIEDNLRYSELALKLADKLLSQTIDKKERKRISEQKINVYYLITAYYSESMHANLTKTFEYGEKIISVYQELKDTANIIDGYRSLSQYYLAVGNFPKALQSLQKALSISKELNYKKGIALCLLQMADIYRDNGENIQALENYQNALTILYEIKDTLNLYNGLAAIGGFYYKQNNIQKALEYYQKVISLCEAKQWNDKIGYVYGWIGQVYRDHKDYSGSLLNYQKSLSMFKAHSNQQKVKDILDAIGTVYNELGNYTEALTYHFKALKIAEELKSEYGIASTYICLARVYHNQNKYILAKQYNDSALTLLKKQFDLNKISEAELLASRIDSARGNGMSAYEHYKQYVALSSKLKGDEIHRAAQKEKYQNEFDKQKTEQDKKDAIAKSEIKKQKIIRNSVSTGLVIVFLFSVYVYKQRRRIAKEKKKGDDLLLNILPAEVAEELKAKGSAEAKHFDEVTVMFTDFKGFTQISEKLTPSELVAEIHTCFKAFDNIITKYNIEKIKTIGDSYMCAGGLPVTNTTNAIDVVNAALEIQQFMQHHLQQRKKENKEPFEIRIGIHTGPVVAGIVGVKKFAYDIWGDTVNIASRMESSGEAGKVNISGSTYELVKDKFNCAHRGKIQAKNKGEIDMYFVETNN